VPIAPSTFKIKAQGLSDEQLAAARHVLHSQDRVIMIRGAAGTGKTTLLKATAEAIAANGRQVFVAAPTADGGEGSASPRRVRIGRYGRPFPG